ncbi:MAG: hypothetical protein IJ580_10200 [Prevotella sp.]|nr:hypothetical protein [Prevotella sp.]MBR1557088.1 hypothetical protein [Prevotella sp.]
MANYVLQEMALKQENGKRKVYPRMQVYTRFDYEQVLERMTAYPGAPGKGTLMAAFDMLSQTIRTCLPDGHTIKIDGLGTFSLSLEFDDEKPNEIADENDSMAYRKVRIKDVNFKADPALLSALNKETEFMRAEPEVHRYNESTLNRKQRIKRALAHIAEHGFLSLADYVRLSGLSRTTASNELRSFEQDPSVPIKGSGLPPHKVWVKA